MQKQYLVFYIASKHSMKVLIIELGDFVEGISVEELNQFFTELLSCSIVKAVLNHFSSSQWVVKGDLV